ncbi:biotin--[acetyl-CoA-carboxylase] ligase [candidate division bacterium WOR-3 4484_18]|uniref:Biotin--[acetyl-CoA-carboxylase] ligase n=1 Tax=candidate division WOR-3 bacterium 4484_18 TaxID=2020626 RepID=A0A257LSS5_UNCW3|nr:MAG: biotin--[acetyl-CoA-carboxylase] ligase [candidate division bacterium WOR-3 4484_18]
MGIGPIKVVGSVVFRYTVVDSTQEELKRLLQHGKLPIGTAVIAEEQTRGKGRWGRGWWSPKGGIWCSLLMSITTVPYFRYALAVIRWIDDTYGLDALIRWPNDVIINRKKVAGILIERHRNLDLVGIGINVNIAQIDNIPYATSMQIECGYEIEIDKKLPALFEAIQSYAKMDDDTILHQVRTNMAYIGSNLYIGDKCYKFEDIDTTGNMILTSGKERLVVNLNQVDYLDPMFRFLVLKTHIDNKLTHL